MYAPTNSITTPSTYVQNMKINLQSRLKEQRQRTSLAPASTAITLDSPHKMSMTIETIDVPTALRYLEKNIDNRDIRPRVVSALMREMVEGRYQLTHQGIAFTWEDKMIDGQHRLWAFIMAVETIPEFTIQLPVFRGVDPATYKVIDNGASRCEADLIREERRTVSVAKAMVLGHRISGGNFSRNGSGKLSTDALLNFIDTYRNGIEWAIDFLPGKQFSNATITAVFARASIARPNSVENLEEFICLIRDSAPGALSPNHPASLLRRLVAEKPRGPDLYRKTESAILNFLSGNLNLAALQGVQKEHFILPGWTRDIKEV